VDFEEYYGDIEEDAGGDDRLGWGGGVWGEMLGVAVGDREG
jgi:hypothetical protein